MLGQGFLPLQIRVPRKQPPKTDCQSHSVWGQIFSADSAILSHAEEVMSWESHFLTLHIDTSIAKCNQILQSQLIVTIS